MLGTDVDGTAAAACVGRTPTGATIVRHAGYGQSDSGKPFSSRRRTKD